MVGGSRLFRGSVGVVPWIVSHGPLAVSQTSLTLYVLCFVRVMFSVCCIGIMFGLFVLLLVIY